MNYDTLAAGYRRSGFICFRWERRRWSRHPATFGHLARHRVTSKRQRKCLWVAKARAYRAVRVDPFWQVARLAVGAA
jgi:hypothetical protein